MIVLRSSVVLTGAWWRFLTVTALICVSFTAGAAARHPAEIFIEQSLQQAYGILSDKAMPEEQRRVRFREFMLTAADMERIGRFTLGAYADRASASELRKFGDAFIEHNIVVYSAWLNKYKGQTFRVTGSTKRASDDIIVKAAFMNPADLNGPHSEVDFQVRQTNDGHAAITDMRVDGIWLAVSERGEFTAFLDSNRGSVGALAHHIQSVARQIFSERQPAR